MRAGPRRSPQAGRGRRLFGWGLLAALTLAGCATGDPQDVFSPAGPVAREENELWYIAFPIAVVVFVLVQAGLLYTAFRFRDRGEEGIPKQVAGNTKLEIVWTIIPAVILAGIAVPTVQTIFQLSEVPEEDPLEVRVVGKQYWWEFEYLGDEGQQVVTATEMHVPTDRPVYLRMEAAAALVPDPLEGDTAGEDFNDGVIHSFWVPRLAGKQDVVPGHVTDLSFAADEPGTYEGQCAEFCGLSHSRMKFRVIAQEPEEFQSWLDAQAEPAVEPEGELVQQGAVLFEEATCINCHAIEGYDVVGGTEAGIRIGPSLTHFASRERFAGGILETTEENVAAWIENPQALKAGAQMPNLQLDEEQIAALTAYMMSLE